MLDLALKYEYESNFFDKDLVDILYRFYNVSELPQGDFWTILKALDPEMRNKDLEVKVIKYMEDRIQNEKNIIRLRNMIATKCLGISYLEYIYVSRQLNTFLVIFNDEEKELIKQIEALLQITNIEELKKEYIAVPANIYEMYKTIDYKLTKHYHKIIGEFTHIGQSTVTSRMNDIDVYNIDVTKYFLIITVLTDNEMYVNEKQFTPTLSEYLDMLKNPEQQLGADYISASAINQDFMGLLLQRERKTIFGYNKLSGESIININTGDIVGSATPKFKLNYLPDDFIGKTHYLYNEINFKKVDSQGRRIMPNYILTFDRPTDNDTVAAQKLNIPLYIINSEAVVINRRTKTIEMKKEVEKIKDSFEKLPKLIELYKYQEQTSLLNAGAFKAYIEEHKREREETLQVLSETIDSVLSNLVYSTNKSLQENIIEYEKLNTLCWYINDINYTNKVSLREVKYSPSMELAKHDIFEKRDHFLRQIHDVFNGKFNTYMDLYEFLGLVTVKSTSPDLIIQEMVEDFRIKSLNLLEQKSIPNIEISLFLYNNDIRDFSNITIYKKDGEKVIFQDRKPIYYYTNNTFSPLKKATSIYSLSKRITEYTTKNSSFKVTFNKNKQCIINNEIIDLDALETLQNVTILEAPTKKEAEPEIIGFE